MRQRTADRKRFAASINRIASPAAMPIGLMKMMGLASPCRACSDIHCYQRFFVLTVMLCNPIANGMDTHQVKRSFQGFAPNTKRSRSVSATWLSNKSHRQSGALFDLFHHGISTRLAHARQSPEHAPCEFAICAHILHTQLEQVVKPARH